MTVRLSVIVPVLDEEACIGDQLARLGNTAGLHEVIVADGGSTDRTRAIVQDHPAVRLVDAPRGRGPQLNAGAQVATGDVFLFLHADVVAPPDLAFLVSGALADPAVVGGAFRIRTVAEDRAGWPGHVLWLADIRSRYSRLPYGDQGIFVRASIFAAVGGFQPIPLFEDLEFSQRLRRAGRLRVLPRQLRVSGRRFMSRPVRSAVLMNVLPWCWRLGVPPESLARIYGMVR